MSLTTINYTVDNHPDVFDYAMGITTPNGKYRPMINGQIVNDIFVDETYLIENLRPVTNQLLDAILKQQADPNPQNLLYYVVGNHRLNIQEELFDNYLVFVK